MKIGLQNILVKNGFHLSGKMRSSIEVIWINVKIEFYLPLFLIMNPKIILFHIWINLWQSNGHKICTCDHLLFQSAVLSCFQLQSPSISPGGSSFSWTDSFHQSMLNLESTSLVCLIFLFLHLGYILFWFKGVSLFLLLSTLLCFTTCMFQKMVLITKLKTFIIVSLFF